jgi:hypothetical protein
MSTTTAQQAATLETATRQGTHWTQAELDQVRNATEPLVEVAQTIGRSLYAVWTARSVVTERAERAVAVERKPLAFDRGFTDIEALFAD